MLRRLDSINKNEVFKSPVELALRSSSNQVEYDCWLNVIEWLENYPNIEFNSKIETSLTNLKDYQDYLRDIFIDLISKNFNFDGLEFKNELEIDLQQFIKILNNIKLKKCIYQEIINLLQFSDPYKKSINKEVNELFNQFLIFGYGDIEISPFIINLKQFIYESIFLNKPRDNLNDCLEVIKQLDFPVIRQYICKQVAKEEIVKFITEKCSNKRKIKIGDYVKSHIFTSIYPSLSTSLVCLGISNYDSNMNFAELLKFAKSNILKLKTNELYEIILNYPTSAVCLKEFKELIETSEQRIYVVNKFNEIIKLQLLHPGKTTSELIHYYILMTKCFLFIDPNGVMLDKVSRNTRKLLKERSDTIKFVVDGLLNDQSNNPLKELSDELILLGLKFKNHHITKTIDYENWQPDPIDALSDFVKSQVGDIVESLVSLYDSKSLFINEITKHFAKDLIDTEDYNIEKILKKLDLIIKKFDENKNEFNNLKVMIKDVEESKLTDSIIHKYEKSTIKDFKFHSTIISYLFWPKDLIKISHDDNNLEEFKFNFPKTFQDLYDAYSKLYSMNKLGRQLKPLQFLGSVTVELELLDRTLVFEVNPEYASVIYVFNGDDFKQLILKEIVELLKMEETKVVKILEFWIKKGIIEEIGTEIYRVLELENGNNKKLILSNDSPDDYNNFSNNFFNQQMNINPFIFGMLKNLGSLEFEKIKKLLEATITNFQCNELELKEHLDKLVQEDKLEMAGDMYKSK